MKPAALVTGGAKRVGQGIALSLAHLGFDIALHYNNSKNEAQKTATKIKKLKRRCEIFACNLFDETEVKDLLPAVKRRFPGLELLVNSASIFEKSGPLTSDSGSLERHFAINFKAPYILSTQFAKNVRSGNIINILDTHIVKNQSAYSDYLLSKKILAEFTKMVAVQFAPRIRVSAVAPGLILPPKGEADSYLKRLAEKIPLKRKGSIDSIAQTVQFLIQNDFITGQIIFVDGGEHLL